MNKINIKFEIEFFCIGNEARLEHIILLVISRNADMVRNIITTNNLSHCFNSSYNDTTYEYDVKIDNNKIIINITIQNNSISAAHVLNDLENILTILISKNALLIKKIVDNKNAWWRFDTNNISYTYNIVINREQK